MGAQNWMQSGACDAVKLLELVGLAVRRAAECVVTAAVALQQVRTGGCHVCRRFTSVLAAGYHATSCRLPVIKGLVLWIA